LSSSSEATLLLEKKHQIPSPVLTTEQLYQTAGWLEHQSVISNVFQEENDERHVIYNGLRNSTSLPQEGLCDLPSTPLFARRRAILCEMDQFGSTSFFAHNDEDGGDYNDSDRINAETIRQIQSSFADSTFLKSLSSISTTQKVVLNPIEGEREDSRHTTKAINQDKDEKGNGVKKKRISVQEEEDGGDRVPKSMAEIYKLSNRNRKNKEKKKLREDIMYDPTSSPLHFEEDERSSDNDLEQKAKRQKDTHIVERDGENNQDNSRTQVASKNTNPTTNTIATITNPNTSTATNPKNNINHGKTTAQQAPMTTSFIPFDYTNRTFSLNMAPPPLQPTRFLNPYSLPLPRPLMAAPPNGRGSVRPVPRLMQHSQTFRATHLGVPRPQAPHQWPKH